MLFCTAQTFQMFIRLCFQTYGCMGCLLHGHMLWQQRNNASSNAQFSRNIPLWHHPWVPCGTAAGVHSPHGHLGQPCAVGSGHSVYNTVEIQCSYTNRTTMQKLLITKKSPPPKLTTFQAKSNFSLYSKHFLWAIVFFFGLPLHLGFRWDGCSSLQQ